MHRSSGSPLNLPRLAYITAWGFFAVAAAVGALLRVQVFHPLVPLEYAHLLHAHSHAAFLGWVFNAFFALALRFFVPPGNHHGFWTVFLVMQIAALGMLLSFPFQGYAAASISFSTLHLVAGAVFAWKVVRRNVAAPAAQVALRWAIVFLVLSAAGPLALGPISAAGMKGTPWYQFAIYFYLHFQYNGWFVFFLLAVSLQSLQERGVGFDVHRVVPALHWLAGGCLLTVILSAWWMGPSLWMHVVAGLGGLAQLVGFVLLWRTRAPVAWFSSRIGSVLGTLALLAFTLKLALQLVSAWPALADLAMARPVVMGFLHLIFLAVVTPLLIAWATELGWLRIRGIATLGLGLLLLGAAATELVLFAQPLPIMLTVLGDGLHRPQTLAVAALTMALGAGLLGTGLRRPPGATESLHGQRREVRRESGG